MEDGAKLILGDRTQFTDKSSISSGYKVEIKTDLDEKTGIVTTTVSSLGTINPPAIILGDEVIMEDSDIYEMMG
ncbi:MAG: hypothetical protein RRY13_08805, partial [Akkermansia sp.]